MNLPCPLQNLFSLTIFQYIIIIAYFWCSACSKLNSLYFKLHSGNTNKHIPKNSVNPTCHLFQLYFCTIFAIRFLALCHAILPSSAGVHAENLPLPAGQVGGGVPHPALLIPHPALLLPHPALLLIRRAPQEREMLSLMLLIMSVRRMLFVMGMAGNWLLL